MEPPPDASERSADAARAGSSQFQPLLVALVIAALIVAIALVQYFGR